MNTRWSALLLVAALPAPMVLAGEWVALATPAGIVFQYVGGVEPEPPPRSAAPVSELSPGWTRNVVEALIAQERTSRQTPARRLARTAVFAPRGLEKAPAAAPRPALINSDRPLAIRWNNRRRYAPWITRIAAREGLDPALLHAVIGAESAYDPRAVSPAGAQGLMQLMPATAMRFGVNDPFDPVDNVAGGARYLRLLIDQFGDLRLALAAYNAGEQAVARHGGIPPYRETRRYVPRVLALYRHFRE